MATKLKAMIPPVAVSQRPSFVGSKDDGQKLIRKTSVRASSSRRPKFSIRPRKSAPSKSKKSKANPVASSQSWDVFAQQDAQAGKDKKTRKRRISLKMVRKAGKRVEWLLKKGAKYFGIAIIKIFNQPGLYTEESRTCVV